MFERLLKKGMEVSLDVNTDDIDLHEWILEQPKNRFTIREVDYEQDMIWIDGCDIGIWFSDIIWTEEEEENDI